MYPKGSIIQLGRRETLTLEALMQAQGQVVAIDELLAGVWPCETESVAKVRGVGPATAKQAARAAPEPDHWARRVLPRGCQAKAEAASALWVHRL